MLQERPDSAAGVGHLRREWQHRQLLLRPPAQVNLQLEHPQGWCMGSEGTKPQTRHWC